MEDKDSIQEGEVTSSSLSTWEPQEHSQPNMSSFDPIGSSEACPKNSIKGGKFSNQKHNCCLTEHYRWILGSECSCGGDCYKSDTKTQKCFGWIRQLPAPSDGDEITPESGSVPSGDDPMMKVYTCIKPDE